MHAHRDREEEPRPAVFVYVLIQFGVTQNLRLEPGKRQEHHHGKTLQAHHNLLSYLVLQEPRMLHHVVVKHEIIRKRRKQEVQQMHSDERRDDERYALPGNVVSWPGGNWRSEELFGVSPVNFVGERRVREMRDELLPRRVLPSCTVNGRGWKERRHWNEFTVEAVQHEVIRDV